MASLLESKVAQLVASGFKGKLLPGTLRREVSTTLDAKGDPVVGTPQTFSFEGIRDTFSAFSANQAGIPLTDARILIIAGSIKTVPVKDDKVFIRGTWFQLRQLVAQDPANATYTFAGFEIEAPA